MLNCKEITELCSQEMERSLGLGERMSLATHLLMCSGCTNFRKQMKALRLVARTYAEGGAAPPPRTDESSQ
jgi:hypothetical protein